MEMDITTDTLTIIHELDKVLAWFVEANTKGNVIIVSTLPQPHLIPDAVHSNLGQIYLDEIIKDIPYLDNAKFKAYGQQVLNKLRDDGFIASKFETGIKWYYIITLEGIIYHSYGGYIKTHRDKTYENNRLRTLERRQMSLHKTLNFLTAVIALGTLVAAWYYLKEIFRY